MKLQQARELVIEDALSAGVDFKIETDYGDRNTPKLHTIDFDYEGLSRYLHTVHEDAVADLLYASLEDFDIEQYILDRRY